MKKLSPYFLPLIIIAVAYLVLMNPFSDNTNMESVALESLPASTHTGKALIGGDFSLLDAEGDMRTDAEFRSNHMVVYFGFTYCPHICPTGLLRITNAMESLPKQVAEKVKVLFITVDPERDTPERIKEYLLDYHPSIIGLTGSDEALAEVKAAYKAYGAKEEEDEDGNYNVGHSSFIYVMGAEGEYLKHFPHNVKDVELAAYLMETVSQ